MPLSGLVEQRARAVARLPTGSVSLELLHSLSLLALSLMKATRLGQPPALPEEEAWMARHRGSERLLSDAEASKVLPAVAATLSACAAQLPAVLRAQLVLWRRAEQAAPASDVPACYAQQTLLLVPCQAAFGLLRHLVHSPEAPHVAALWHRALSPQAFADFLAAALEAAVMVHQETGEWGMEGGASPSDCASPVHGHACLQPISR